MRHKLILLALLCVQLPLLAQNDTIRNVRAALQTTRSELTEERIPLKDTPALKKTPDSLVRVIATRIDYYTDTLTAIAFVPDSIAKQREEIIRTDSTDRRGHYIEVHIGAGYGSLGYSLNEANSRTTGSFSGLLQLQYAYFFHRNVGIGVGAWFTNYVTNAQLGGTYTWLDQIDSDNEQHYDHSVQVNRWKERQTIHNVGIPISLQFQEKKDDWKAGVFASIGAAPAFSVMKKYRVLEGELKHTGYYPAWNLTLDDTHEFGTYADYPDRPEAQGDLATKVQVAVFADLGALIPLTTQVELFVGGYFNYTVTDANNSAKQDLGWKDEHFAFMNEYKGIYATTQASASHPWEAGLKLGIHWRHIKPDKHTIVDYFDYFTRQDTLVELLARQDTVVTDRIDTLTRAHIAKAAEEVEKFNKIYFDFDSYKLSEESKNYLSSIVGVLNKVPDAKIAIDGHASEEGQRRHNERLAYNRAKAVAKYLVDQGINKKRVIVIGHGSLVPNEENVNHELPLDRRAEVKVVQKQSEIK